MSSQALVISRNISHIHFWMLWMILSMLAICWPKFAFGEPPGMYSPDEEPIIAQQVQSVKTAQAEFDAAKERFDKAAALANSRSPVPREDVQEMLNDAQASMAAAKIHLDQAQKDCQRQRACQLRLPLAEGSTNSPSPDTTDPAPPAQVVQADSIPRDEFNFYKNSIGKAGEAVSTTIPYCGDKAGQNACNDTAHSLESMSKWSTYSDYASYAAVAGVVVPMMAIPSNQKDGLETTASIQTVAGVAAIATGAVDIGLGMKARRGSVENLSAAKKDQSAICAKFANMSATDAENDPDKANCDKFGSGKKIDTAIDQIKSASTSHFLIGGLKALGGAAALKLAANARDKAKDLEDINNNTAAAVPAPPAAPSLPIANAAPTSSGIQNNSVGFLATDPNDTGSLNEASTTSNSDAATLAALGGGASVASRPGDPSFGNSKRNSGNGLLRGKSGGSGPGKGFGLNASADGSAEASDSSGEAPEKDSIADWSGGGGALNRGGFDLGGGDGGFGNLLGSMTAGLLGGDKALPSNTTEFARAPASESRAGNASTNESENRDKNLFERVSHAIDRQISAGQIIGEVNDLNKI